MFTNFKRVCRFAFTAFYRNKGISLAAIFILTITIGLATTLFFIRGISSYVISEVENRIDITAYFKTDTAEQDILNVRDQILKMSPSIKSVQYVSQDQALANFTAAHQSNPVFTTALSEVGDNPFLPSLNITTTGSPAQYQQVATLLQSDQFSSFIDRVDYSDKKDTINKVFAITSNINLFGVGAAMLLALIFILVVFNTMKLAIENSREEITTMRMVGASSWFVRGPFIVQGVIFASISFVICFLGTGAASLLLSSRLELLMPGFSLWHYFLSNAWLIILIQLGGGIILGTLTSFMVVQKYLEV